MVKSNAKGGAWERELGRILSEWGTGERNPPELWRSTMSGGWPFRGVANVGDLRPTSADCTWGVDFRSWCAVEAKHRKEDDLDFWYLFTRKNGGPIFEWWHKLCTECEEHDLMPWLVIKRNYYPTILCFPSGVASCCKDMVFPQKGMAVITLEDALETDYETWKARYDQWRD